MIPITLTETRYGQMLILPQDEYVGKALIRYGDYSYEEAKLFQQFCPVGATVYDIGSNHGYFAMAMSYYVGPEGTVVAVEPQRLLASLINASSTLQNRYNIHVINAGLGSDTGEMRLAMPNYEAAHNYGAICLNDLANERGWKTPIYTLDTLVQQFDNKATFIKIDVEGMECEVLKGGTNTLTNLRPWLYVESDRLEYNYELLKYLESFDYRMYWAIVPLYSPDNFKKIPDNDYGNRVSLNFLCVPPGCQLEGDAIEATSDNPEPPIKIIHA